MKLMTLKQYMKMSKKALIRKITKTLRTMPKKKIAIVCYNITKSKLPRLPYEQTKMKMLRRYKKLKFTEESEFVKQKKMGNVKNNSIKEIWTSKKFNFARKKLKFTEEIPKRKTKRKTKKIVGKIYHTKNGQPYKILASGKARFVKR